MLKLTTSLYPLISALAVLSSSLCQYTSGTLCAPFLFFDRHRYLFHKLVINHYFILCFITPIFLADNRWLLFSRIPFRTLAFPWSPWRAGSPRRKSLPNGKRSRSSWWDWRKLRRKANPDTHTGPRPCQGSLIDARHYYWVPVRITSFVVLTHGATVNNPPPFPPIVCDRMQEFEVKEKVIIFQIGDFGNLWQTFLIWMWCTILSGTEDLFVLHCIISHFWTNFIQLWCSLRIQYFERRLFIHVYSLFCFWFFCSYFVYMKKVEEIVCKREINYFGGLPLE